MADDLDGLDLVFLALPHGESQRLAPALVGRVGLLVDLAADFRLTDPAAYDLWYGSEHEAPGLLGRFAYGLPELFGSALEGPPRWPCRAVTRQPPRWPWPLWSGPACRNQRNHRRRRLRDLGRRTRTPRRPCTSPRWTRTSPPTAS